MKKLRTLFATACVAFAAVASAQTCCQSTCPAQEEAYNLGYYPFPYGFVQVQGGGSTTFTSGKNIMDLVTPTYSLGVGAMFTPVVGARIHVNGYTSKSKLNSIDYKYDYKYINSNLDVMLNINNIFSKTKNHLLNVYLIGGVGLNYAWDNDKLVAAKAAGVATEDMSNSWGKGTSRKSLLSHCVRAGLLLDFNVAKHWSVGVEGDINNLSDRFNSKYGNSNDWMLTLQASVTYKFGFKKAERPAPEPKHYKTVEKVDTVWYDETIYEDITKDREIKKEIFFGIRESGVETSASQIADVAEFLKNTKDAEITITSYADKGTGNPKLNMKYSKSRAEKTKQALVDAGVDASIIKSVEWKGDTVQPYEENDKNRLSVISGHGVYTEKEPKTVKKFRLNKKVYEYETDKDGNIIGEGVLK